jgi:hypothetical protein
VVKKAMTFSKMRGKTLKTSHHHIRREPVHSRDNRNDVTPRPRQQRKKRRESSNVFVAEQPYLSTSFFAIVFGFCGGCWLVLLFGLLRKVSSSRGY